RAEGPAGHELPADDHVRRCRPLHAARRGIAPEHFGLHHRRRSVRDVAVLDAQLRRLPDAGQRPRTARCTLRGLFAEPRRLAGHAAVLPARGRRLRELPPASPLSPPSPARLVRQTLGSNNMIESLTPILIGTVGAATPLILAGLGELVAERSGVINLGVEGMMLVGAIAGFAVVVGGGGNWGGLGAGAIAGAASAILYCITALT